MAEDSRQNIVDDRHVGDRDCFFQRVSLLIFGKLIQEINLI